MKTTLSTSAPPVSKESFFKKNIGLIFISPWIIGFLAFQLYPLLASLVYSFTDYNILSIPKFVGLKNYIDIFTNDESFYNSLIVTFVYTIIAVPGKLAFALFIAMLLNLKVRFSKLYTTIYYLPSIFGGSVAISILWRFLFMKEGIMNKILNIFSVPPVDWLGSPSVALFTVSLLTVWQFGSSMVIFLAGLKNIPKELYEAASLDGASPVRRFIHVSIPMLTPMILFNLVMQTINAFQEFTGAFIITNGGPMKATYLMSLLIYDNAFRFFKMGYASALSWILFIIIIAITLILFKTSNKWTHYEDKEEF